MVFDVRALVGFSGSVTGVSVFLVLGFYQGLEQVTLQLGLLGLPMAIVSASAVPAVAVFTALTALSGLLLTREVFDSRDTDRELRTGPPITAIVPVYRDGAVLDATVDALLASDYADLEVAIVAEPDDESTLAVARELADRPDVRLLINGRPGSKARAINDAVSRLEGEYFCVLDADERVDPTFVPTAMSYLVEGDCDVFQARRVPRANGAVEALAYCERLLFHASYTLVEPLGFTYCRSSSSAFTRDAFEAVGGLDDLLTEDIDFAHTCFRRGLEVRQARNITNEMEAPHTLRDLWGQRKRWRIGHLQVLSKALRREFQPSGIRGAASTARLVTSLSASVFMIALVAKVAVLVYLGLYALAAVPLVAVFAAMLPTFVRDYRAGHVRRLSPTVVLAPLIYPGFGLVTIRCAFEYVLSWDGEWYRVDKSGT